MYAAAFLGASLALWGFAGQAQGQSPDEADEDAAGRLYVAGELLVSYKEADPSARSARKVPEEIGGQVEEELPAVGTQVLAFPEIKAEPSGEQREDLLARKKRELESDPAVAAADYNYFRRALFTPNDPLFGRQYGLARIKTPDAWNMTRGNRDARIAVVDTGIDAGHPDFAGGRVVAQRSFAGPTESPSAQDVAGHGTTVSGVAVAITNNSRGVAGACQDCSLVAAKVSNSLSITVEDEIQGINWSVDNGADVINLSIGGPGYIEAEARAVNRAWNRGVVVVAAAGNANSDEVNYPAGYRNAISVAATDRRDRKAGFSNYGGTVDVAAPGVDILTTDVRGAGGYAGGDYTTISGTSFSSPFVAGLAGLLDSQGRSRDQIRQRIESTADDLGPNGKDRIFGFGRINAAGAVGAASSSPSPNNSAPTIADTLPEPGSRTRDRTPTISAVVGDKESDLGKQDLSMFLDGRKVPFDYDATTGKMSYTPKDDLSRGEHSVKVLARDDKGRETVKRWTFKVEKKRGRGTGPGSYWPFGSRAKGFLPDAFPFAWSRFPPR